MNVLTAPKTTQNVLLRSLPDEERERLERYFRIVPLAPGQRLSSIEEQIAQLYFPLEGAISRIVQLPSGEAVEVGIIGNDGVLGLPLALGGSYGLGLHRVQIGGLAAVITAEDFHEHVRSRGGPLMYALLVYTNLQLQVVTQLTACHCLHRIEQRLSRCILQLLDRAGIAASVRITHDTLAEFLGVHRPSITYALQALSAQGVIESKRRHVIVQDRAALAKCACECYGVLRNITSRELARLTPPQP